ncbi:MAG TPA: RbsD/FucU family protein [Spirochaetia bacterium]|nr:RbsD/FucU family protein [Spirochaetia bacterium]
MLKNIPSILPPDLLKILMEMGHGDELVIGDGNFPAASHGQRLVRCDGHGVSELLEAIMKLFPLDQFVKRPAFIMEVVPGDPTKPTIWEEYRKIIKRNEPDFTEFEMVERFAFYEQSKKAYCIVATGESALYANIILKKGVIRG